LVKEYRREDREGFLYGKVTYEGVESWRGHKLKIWIKNENIVAWKDGKVVVTSPDLICVVDEAGHAITNAELEEGTKVTAIGVRAPEVWLTQKGLELFGPKNFGFKFDYTPIRE
jgi:DUF917 family protein